jgi:hypothetical protein
MSVFLQFAKIFRRNTIKTVFRSIEETAIRANHVAQEFNLIALITGYDDLKAGAITLRTRPNSIWLSRHQPLHSAMNHAVQMISTKNAPITAMNSSGVMYPTVSMHRQNSNQAQPDCYTVPE